MRAAVLLLAGADNAVAFLKVRDGTCTAAVTAVNIPNLDSTACPIMYVEFPACTQCKQGECKDLAKFVKLHWSQEIQKEFLQVCPVGKLDPSCSTCSAGNCAGPIATSKYLTSDVCTKENLRSDCAACKPGLCSRTAATDDYFTMATCPTDKLGPDCRTCQPGQCSGASEYYSNPAANSQFTLDATACPKNKLFNDCRNCAAKSCDQAAALITGKALGTKDEKVQCGVDRDGKPLYFDGTKITTPSNCTCSSFRLALKLPP